MLLSLGIIFGYIAIIALVSFIICRLMDVWYKHLDKKLKEKYPEFFIKRQEMEDISDEAIDDALIHLKNRIDAILAELPYLPEEDVEQKKNELENFRRLYKNYELANDAVWERINQKQAEITEIYNAHPELKKLY